MKLPRDKSGRALAQALCKHWGYVQVHQTGSHLILQTEDPSHHRIEVPAHGTLRVGTLSGILRAVAKHKGVPREKLLESL